MTTKEEAYDPLISVIVPVYNVEKYIHRCVDSILGQTYTNLEVILVDDGSPDKCGEICDKYASADARVKVIHQENAGLSEARNAGLDICTGDYVAFVDSDDYVCDGFVEGLFSIIDDSDYVCGGFCRVDHEGNYQYSVCPDKDLVTTGKEALNLFYYGSEIITCVCVWGKLFRKEIWKELRFPKGLLFEDIYLMPHILLQCKKVKFISQVGYYYRETPNSITTSTSEEHRRKAFMDCFEIWNNHKHLYDELSLKEFSCAVECLKIEKIIAHSISDSIPEGLCLYAKSTLKNSVRNVLHKKISLKKKLRYVLFAVFGKKVYKFIKRIIK